MEDCADGGGGGGTEGGGGGGVKRDRVRGSGGYIWEGHGEWSCGFL